MTDMINNPPHYKAANGMEAIDVVEAFFPADPHLSHVFKYMARSGKKDTPESNIRKAIWWLVRKLSFMTGKRFLPLLPYHDVTRDVFGDERMEISISVAESNEGEDPKLAIALWTVREDDGELVDKKLWTIPWQAGEHIGQYMLSRVEDIKRVVSK